MTTQTTASGKDIKKESPDPHRQEQVRKPRLWSNAISQKNNEMFILYILVTTQGKLFLPRGKYWFVHQWQLFSVLLPILVFIPPFVRMMNQATETNSDSKYTTKNRPMQNLRHWDCLQSPTRTTDKRITVSNGKSLHNK